MKKTRLLSKAFYILMSCALLMMPTMVTYANSLPKVVDMAGLISQDELQDLDTRCDSVGEQYGLDVVIVTDTNSSISSAMEEADDYFDYNGYGIGDDRSGVLLYINMSTRDYWISTRGYGITVFTDDGINYIGDQISAELSDGNYYQALSSFVDLCEDFACQAQTGRPYTSSNLPKGPFPAIPYLIISVSIGCLAALIYSLKLKGELKSVAPQNSAVDYISQGSVNVRDAGSIFLYRNVARTERVQSSSGSSSSTHRSSSGAIHGGGGGKF